MKNILQSKLTILLLFVCFQLFGQTINNPVLPHVADAGVMKYNGKYYIGGVHTDGDFYVSKDLVHWDGPIHVVSIDNEWIKNSGVGNDQIHANDMIYWNGDFHLYWSVNYWGNDKHAVHIVHAQSDSVLGPYKEPDTRRWMDNRIDPKVFKDDDGQLYMYMVRFTDGNTIWGRKMKSPSEFAGEPVCLFASLPNTWETMDNRVAEGPWVIKYRDRYYMMYNANHTATSWGNYQLGVAEADSPLGFQNGNKYSYPVVAGNQMTLEDEHVNMLCYNESYNPLFFYTEQQPSVGWKELDYNEREWKLGELGFSSRKIEGSTLRRQGTVWNSSSLWIRKKFTADEYIGNVALRINHEGDTEVYLNGELIYNKAGADFCMLDLNPAQRSLIVKGENLLAVKTSQGRRSNFFDIALFDMKDAQADDILVTPGQPNILRGPNGFEWWLIYMANKNKEPRGQYINRVHFFDKTLYVDGITSTRTTGYHPEPASPSFSITEESAAFGQLKQVQPAKSYLFETNIRTSGEAGIIVWKKDEDNYAHVGLDSKTNSWYFLSVINGMETMERFPLSDDFRWGVYHQIRMERDETFLKVWIDEMPAPGKCSFNEIALCGTLSLPGVFDVNGDALFEGTIYTIGFDKDEIQWNKKEEELIEGELLNDYELSFQISGLGEMNVAGCYPVYVDQYNYVKVIMDGKNQRMKVVVVQDGKQILRQDYSLSYLQTHYPDVKYTDFIEKNYRFKSPVWMNSICLNRHEVEDRSRFVDNMFDKFVIEYLNNGEWFPIQTNQVKIDEHPAYNRLDIEPVRAEGIRLINKEATDQMQHIYKIKLQEQWKDSYNFRSIRRGNKLYLYIDGREQVCLDISFPASRIGFYSENASSKFDGILYYHIQSN